MKMIHRSVSFLVLLLLLLVLAACGASEPASDDILQSSTVDGEDTAVLSEDTVPQSSEDAYPVATAVVQDAPASDEPYPPAEAAPLPEPTPLPDVYPPVDTEEQFLEPRFQLDLPLEPGATVVTGQAPAGLAVMIADVTYNGQFLGSGTADGNGRFTIDVSPLNPGNRVGVTFAALDEGLDLAQMAEKYYPYRGEGFINIPNVGIFYDSALVNE